MADQLCIEYHHDKSGNREVYIVGADGQGVAFDAHHLEGVVGALTGFLKTDIPEGRVIYMTLDEKGGVRCEEGRHHA